MNFCRAGSVSTALAVVLAVSVAGIGCDEPATPGDGGIDADTRDVGDGDAPRGDVDSTADATGDARLDAADGVGGFGFGAGIDGRATPVVEPDAEAFFRSPWPSDARRDDDGTLATEQIPGQGGDVVDSYIEVMEEMEGFSLMPVVYVPFDRELPDSALPPVPETLAPDSSLQLVRLDDGTCGERVPVEARWERDDGRYTRKHTLQVVPRAAFSLEPESTYGLVVLKDFGNSADVGTKAPARFYDALRDRSDGDLAESLGPIRKCADELPFSLDQIGVATVFTTHDPMDATARLRDHATNPDEVAPPNPDNIERADDWSDDNDFELWAGEIEVPIFQKGEPPYRDDGSLAFDEDGTPRVVRREKTGVFMMWNQKVEEPYRLLVHSSGTGADLGATLFNPLSEWLAKEGYLVATFVSQFHGDRPDGGQSPTISTFNYLNASAGRSVLRQQVAEEAYFRRFMVNELTEASQFPEISEDRATFYGHSQGAIVGGMLAGLETGFETFLLNGVGGYASTSAILESRDDINTREVLELFFNATGEPNRFHLAVQMIQLVSDVNDPLHYAPNWTGTDAGRGGVDMLIVNGAKDENIAKRAMRALPARGDVPPVGEPGWPFDPHDLIDLEPEEPPVSGNRTAPNGDPLTLGTILDDDHGHATVLEDEAAKRAAKSFLGSALDPPASIEP